MGMFDDLTHPKKKPTRRQLEAMNKELLDGAADMAARLEYAINKYNIPVDELLLVKAPK